jgi:protein SCO1/2
MAFTHRNRGRSVLLSLGTAVLGAGIALADEQPAEMPAHHHHMASPMMTSTASYQVPDLKLVRADGKEVSLAEEMNDGRPVVLNFIYTSCTSVCPLMSQIFSQFQDELGADRDQVHLMSISIDPEADTPARLTEYAKGYGAGPEWQFYTGTVSASIVAQRAFDVYLGDKMNHTAATLIRGAPGEPWLRIDGFATPDQLMHEYHQVLAKK